MRFFCYNEPIWGAENDLDENGFRKILGNEVITISDEDIRRDYYPWWKEQLKKAGKDPANYTFEDCLDNWRVVNWAWESRDE